MTGKSLPGLQKRVFRLRMCTSLTPTTDTTALHSFSGKAEDRPHCGSVAPQLHIWKSDFFRSRTGSVELIYLLSCRSMEQPPNCSKVFIDAIFVEKTIALPGEPDSTTFDHVQTSSKPRPPVFISLLEGGGWEAYVRSSNVITFRGISPLGSSHLPVPKPWLPARLHSSHEGLWRHSDSNHTKQLKHKIYGLYLAFSFRPL
jgi:hypothetical protein